MTDFTHWDRKTLERFAQDAERLLLQYARSVPNNDKPECLDKWEREMQLERECNRCRHTLECKAVRNA